MLRTPLRAARRVNRWVATLNNTEQSMQVSSQRFKAESGSICYGLRGPETTNDVTFSLWIYVCAKIDLCLREDRYVLVV